MNKKAVPGGKRKRQVFKILLICVLSIWNIYFLTHLIFFTDKFKTPYSNINLNEYIINDKDNHLLNLSTDEKVADFQYMMDFLKENYPLKYIDEQVYRIDLNKKNNEYLEEIKNTKNDFEFYLVLRKYFSTIKSAHTYLLIPEQSEYDNMRVNNMANILEDVNVNNLTKHWENSLETAMKEYPIKDIIIFKFIEDKYYETDSLESYITNINGIPIQEFIDAYESVLSKKFDFESNRQYYDKLIFNTEQGIPVLIQMSNGKEINLYLSQEYEFAYIYNDFMNVYEPNIFYIIDEKKRICYYRIDSFEIKYFNKIKQLSMEIIEKEDLVDNIIFDIRNNGGGQISTFDAGILDFFIKDECTFSTRFYTPFTVYHSSFKNKSINNELRKDPINDIKEKGYYYYMVNPKIKYGNNQLDQTKSIYVLIDEGTGSAADTFAAIMKTGNHAILVGENTAGEGLGDTSNIFSLPNSGLLISFMGSYGLNKDGTSNSMYGTAPDYYVKQNIADFKIGNDLGFEHTSIKQIMLYDTQLKFIENNLVGNH